jgi:hypothetical protein
VLLLPVAEADALGPAWICSSVQFTVILSKVGPVDTCRPRDLEPAQARSNSKYGVECSVLVVQLMTDTYYLLRS